MLLKVYNCSDKQDVISYLTITYDCVITSIEEIRKERRNGRVAKYYLVTTSAQSSDIRFSPSIAILEE